MKMDQTAESDRTAMSTNEISYENINNSNAKSNSFHYASNSSSVLQTSSVSFCQTTSSMSNSEQSMHQLPCGKLNAVR